MPDEALNAMLTAVLSDAAMTHAQRVELAVKVKDSMRQEKQYVVSIWALVGTLVTLVGVLVTGCVGYSSLRAQNDQFVKKMDADQKNQEVLRQQDLAQRQKDYSLQFYQSQMTAYHDLCDLTIRLATSEQPAQADIRKLDELVMSRLELVADSDVVSAAVAFGRAIKQKAGVTKTVFGQPFPSLPKEQTDIGQLAYDVTYRCRASLLKAFPNIDIGRGSTYGALTGATAP